jgi:phospholipid/cholesterol/gamma-HCH transport system substrate-binding protein
LNVETRARYVQVGAFTLAVLLASFVFVYWLNSATGLGSRSLYMVRFEGSVSGLLTGSAVLFNGVRVGEVTRDAGAA